MRHAKLGACDGWCCGGRPLRWKPDCASSQGHCSNHDRLLLLRMRSPTSRPAAFHREVRVDVCGLDDQRSCSAAGYDGLDCRSPEASKRRSFEFELELLCRRCLPVLTSLRSSLAASLATFEYSGSHPRSPFNLITLAISFKRPEMDQKLKKLFHRKSRSGSSLGSSSTNGRATPETPSSPTSHPGSPESGKSPKLVSSQFGLGRLEREDESRKTRQRMSQDEARPARPQAAAPSSRPQNGDIATTEAPSRSTPTQHERLKLAPQDVDLSRDLQHLTLNGNAAPRAQMTGKGYSEHVANRNIEASHRQPPARGTVRRVTTDEQLLGTTPQPEPNVANRGNVLPTPAKDTPPRGNTSQDLKVPDSSIMQNYTQNNFLVKDAPEAPSLDGIVDLSNTVDTNVDVQYAPGW